MGPLFSSFLLVLFGVFYASAAYIFLRISRKHKTSLLNVLSIVAGGFVGAVVIAILGAFFFGEKTIGSTIGVISYLTFLVTGSLLCSFVSLNLVERMNKRPNMSSKSTNPNT